MMRTAMRTAAPAWKPRTSPILTAPPGLGPPGLHSADVNVESLDLMPEAGPLDLWLWPHSGEESTDQWAAPWHGEAGWFDESLSAYSTGLRDGLLAAQIPMYRNIVPSSALRRHKDTPSRDASDVSSDTTSTTDTSHEAADEFDALAEKLRGSVGQNQHALAYICKSARSLCTTQQGSRSLQVALEVAHGSQLEKLVQELKGTVLNMSKSPHGNHVLLKCIKILGPVGSQFMVDEMTGKAVVIARDRFGCRVIQQLVESCPQAQVSGLIDELMTDGSRLVRHPFANFVMQSAILYATPARRSQIGDLMSQDLRGNGRHRIAKHVLRLAAEHCGPLEKKVEAPSP